MADELDLVTDATQRPSNSGEGQSMSTKPTEDPETEDALNKLFNNAELESSEGDPKDGDGKPAGSVKDPAAASDSAADGTAPADDADDHTGAPVEDSPTEVPAGDAASDDAAGKPGDAGDDSAGAAAKSPDEFDTYQLPPNTSRKASDSFNAIKEKARGEISARDAEISNLKQKLEELSGRETVTPDEKKELIELRRLRASVEIEKDPEFTKTFDTRISNNNEVVYRTLKEAGMNDEQLEKIKKAGGPLSLKNWDTIYEHLTATQRRTIDGRLTDTENLQRDRNLKLEEAKKNIDQYIEERAGGSQTFKEQEIKVIEENVNTLLPHMEWARQLEVPKDATPEQKKTIEAANKEVSTRMEQLHGILSDRSALNHATMAVAAMETLFLRSKMKSMVAERDALKKEVGELRTRFDKIKRASSPRPSNAPAKPAAPVVDQFTESAEDALERLKSQV